MGCDARADLDAGIAAFVQAPMALPALELHNPLHGLAIDVDAVASQRRPHHAIA